MALIKDNTHGKFKKILKFIGGHAEHKASFDDCLDTLNSYCESHNGCECTLTSCFEKNEMDFSITDKKKTCGRICFDKESGFCINSDNPEL